MKNKLSKLVLLASFTFFNFQYSFAQDYAKGVVYEDVNRNGKFDKNEKRLSNVSVSNGIEVVQTDKKGEYVLPVGDDNIIFVIQPSGYDVPVNSKNLPQFYYIHNPNGAPDLKFKGVAPTGKIPKSVDFGLIPSVNTDEFKIMVFGDPQVYSEKQVEYLKNGVVKELIGSKGYSFGISLGDLVGDRPNLFNPYIDVMSEIGIPWFQVMGNHDMNYDVDTDSLADVSFKAHFGPNTYSFNKGKVHFIVIDDIIYKGIVNGDRKYIGGLRKDQLDFIENDLKFVPKDNLIVLCMHIPLVNNGKHSVREKDNQRLFSILKDFPNTFSMSAHTHIQKQIFIDKSLGWLQDKPHHHYNVGTSNGNWYSGELDINGVPTSTMADGTKKGYAAVTFKGNKYEVDYFVSGADKDFKMNVFFPKIVQKRKTSKANFFVNYYLGGEKDTIDYKVGKGPWQLMNKKEVQDPHLLLEVMKWDTTDVPLSGSRPDNPNLSTHIWVASVPSNLPVGKHKIQIRVRDMFGRTHITEREYVVN